MRLLVIDELEASRARTVSKLEALEKDRERLLGRLEGLDLAIGLARSELNNELEEKRRALEEAQAPIVLEGVDFDAFELEEESLAPVIPFRALRSPSEGRNLPTARHMSDGSDELSGAVSRDSERFSLKSSGPRSRRRKRGPSSKVCPM